VTARTRSRPFRYGHPIGMAGEGSAKNAWTRTERGLVRLVAQAGDRLSARTRSTAQRRSAARRPAPRRSSRTPRRRGRSASSASRRWRPGTGAETELDGARREPLLEGSDRYGPAPSSEQAREHLGARRTCAAGPGRRRPRCEGEGDERHEVGAHMPRLDAFRCQEGGGPPRVMLSASQGGRHHARCPIGSVSIVRP
jgi:hypothetical protein